MSKTLNQGFAAVEAVLIIVIAGIIGGTGYYVWHAQQDTNKTLDQANKSSQSQPAKLKKKASSTTASQTTPAISDKDAISAAVKQYVAANFSASIADTANYSVDDIVGFNAHGWFKAQVGDPLTYVAHKDASTWSVVYMQHMAPQPGSDVCTKYDLPSSWCNGPH